MTAETFDRALATEQIRRIILSYPELIDQGDVVGVGQLLSGVRFGNATGRNAAVIPLDDLITRREGEIEHLYRNAVIFYDDGLPHTKHLVSNIDISFSDDRRHATTRSYYAVLQALTDFPLQVIIAGRYEDVFEATREGWKLMIRREYADLIGDLTHHVRLEPASSLANKRVSPAAPSQPSNNVAVPGNTEPAGGV